MSAERSGSLPESGLTQAQQLITIRSAAQSAGIASLSPQILALIKAQLREWCCKRGLNSPSWNTNR
jgi:hypothetical protein